MAAREAAAKVAHEAFLDQYGGLVRQMAKRGVTRPDSVLKLQALYPAVDVDLADEALKASRIIFSKSQPDDIFSKEALTAGIWFLLGSNLSLAPDYEWAAVNLDLDLMSEVRAALESAEVSPQDVATILGVIGAARRHMLENPNASITGARYQELREELVVALGLVSKQGAFPWPPTRQTVMKRFGGWNEALEVMGIGLASKGRPKGLVKFTHEDYDDAVSDYCFHASVTETSPTFAAYDDWVKHELSAGRSRPSGASVRNIYGTWADALRSVQL